MKKNSVLILMIWLAVILPAGQLYAAAENCPTVPGVVSLSSPSGIIRDTPSALAWTRDSCATWYQVYLADTAGTYKFSQWYEQEDNSEEYPELVCLHGICEIPLTGVLADGDYQWWVRTWNDRGTGEWSSKTTFTVDRSPPGSIMPLHPSGQVDRSQITFSWKKEGAATWYRLFIQNAAGTYTFRRWYEAKDPSAPFSEVVCEGETCFVTLDEDFQDDVYTWQVMGWNDHGRGKWSDRLNFTVSTAASAGSSLHPFDSESALLAYLKKGLEAYSDETVFYALAGQKAAADSMNESSGNPEGLSQDDRGLVFSSTNIQETGVDEADIIKTDGKILYVVSTPDDPRVFYDDAIAAPGSESLSDPSQSRDHAVQIYAITADPAGAREIADIPLQDQGIAVDGIYLLTDQGRDRSDLLVTIGGRAKNVWGCWYNPWYWNNGQTEIALYNVEDPSVPEFVSRLTFDGHLIASRRINTTLHLVTRYTPAVPDFSAFPSTIEAKIKNDTLLENITLDALLPRMSINGLASGRMVDPGTTYLPPFYRDMAAQPSLITVITIDLNDLSQVKTATIAGPTETIYAATDTLYLASSRSSFHGQIWGLDTAVAEPEPLDSANTLFTETTDIHKFNLTVEGPVYAGSGNVPGHLGWEDTKKPYRMSHYQGVLRIATSLGNSWDGSSHAQLTLLKEDPGIHAGHLAEISHIDHIGKPGESLYAVRFAGPRAYMVTFRVTDPLYVFDLSDPFQPKTLGELYIDGYSDYLHPVTTDLLLGIGKDAVPDTGATDFNGRGAWYQGLKLALFDVSDPGAPTQISAITIGNRGTGSDLLYDHHAMAYLPPMNGLPARLAIPVDLYDTVPGHPGFDPAQPWSSYDWTHTGLYLFEIKTGSALDGSRADLVPAGTLVVETRQPDQPYPAWHPLTDRAVLLNDSIHYIHNARVWSADWGQ